jgi:A/G-specific adenine glycosylase
MHDFSLSIVLWYRQNKRDLPWRSTQNPYFIWLSEIILQQTRVQQGLSYYKKFVKLFPTIKSLAEADEQLVLKTWQGLGYYSRARNLHHTAKIVLEEFNGIFPSNYKDIKSLKGVGDYTAAAIASFAYNLPHAVVDGNVYRVLSRYFDESTPYDTSQGKKLFQVYADELLDPENPAEHNQAIMELGALICTPKNPQCAECPLQDSCLALRNKTIAERPMKSKKTKVEKVYFYYLYKDMDNIPMEKRSAGIWKNMYQLPLVESKTKLSKDELKTKVDELFGVKLNSKSPRLDYKHLLSHREINAQFWKINDLPKNDSIFEILNQSELKKYPIPRLIDRFFEDITEDYE